MVRRKNILPPVYPAALGAAVVLYGGTWIGITASASAMILLLALVALCAASTLRRLVPQGCRVPFCIILLGSISAGMLASSLALIRIREENRVPVTLAPIEGIRSVRGYLSQDPAPFGPYSYRSRFSLESCACKDGSAFSAVGDCILVIPQALVRESLPGGVRVTTAASVNYSEGLRLEAVGHFVSDPTSPTGGQEAPLFRVDSVILSSGIGINSSPRGPVSALGWHSPLQRVRAGMRLSLVRILYDWKDSGGFLLALIAGNRDYLESGLANDFRLSGLSHVLALSGTHLSLLALIAIRTGRMIGSKRLSFRLSLAAMFFFVWFAGSSPSLDRALIFAVLMIFGQCLGVESRVLPLLAATSLVQMVLNPRGTVSLAFLLSVTALWGILTFGEALLDISERYVPRRLFSGVAASTGAQLMTAPVLAFTIGVLSPSGIVASFIISPLSSVYLVAGAILLALAAAIPPLSHFFGGILDGIYYSIAYPAHFFAQFPVIEVRLLPVAIAVSIIPLTVGMAIMRASSGSMKRRSPDDSFARL